MKRVAQLLRGGGWLALALVWWTEAAGVARAQGLEDVVDFPELDEVVDLEQVQETPGYAYGTGTGTGTGTLEAAGRGLVPGGGDWLEGEMATALRAAARRDGWALPEASEGGLPRVVELRSEDESLVVRAPLRFAARLLDLATRVRARFEGGFGPGTGEPVLCAVIFRDLPAAPGEPVSAVRLVQVAELGWRVELFLRPGASMQAATLRRSLVEMCLLERIARGLAVGQQPTRDVRVPRWLVVGCRGLLAQWSGHGERALAAAMVTQDAVPELDEVLALDGNELPGQRELLELAATALVLVLRGEEDNENFARWLEQLATRPEPNLSQLVISFIPSDLGVEALENRYRIALARLSDATPLDRLGATESRRLIDRVLVSVAVDGEVVGDTPPGLSVAESLALWEEPDPVQLRRWLTGVAALRERVHPLFGGGPLARMQRLFEQLASGEIGLAEARARWAAEERELETLAGILAAVGTRLDEYQLNHGQVDLDPVREITADEAASRGTSLLPSGGVLAERIERAAWALELLDRVEEEDRGSAESAPDVAGAAP